MRLREAMQTVPPLDAGSPSIRDRLTGAVQALQAVPGRIMAHRAKRKAQWRPVLAGYFRPGFWRRHRWAVFSVFGIATFIYGFFLALLGNFIPVVFVLPHVLLALLAVWALPESKAFSAGWIPKLLFGFVVVLMIWPDYLALNLPGLPWITAIRLFVVPLTIVTLTAVSVSPAFRQRVRSIIDATPMVWKLILIFDVIALISVGFSSTKMWSLNRFMLAQMNWILIFFASCYAFSFENSEKKFVKIAATAISLLTVSCLIEWRLSHVPWAGHVPSFLQIDDPNVQRVLAGSARAASGKYRVQGKSGTPLEFAEFLGMMLPFLVFFVFSMKNAWLKTAGVFALMVLCFVIYLTDSRTGIIGIIVCLLLYVGISAVRAWKFNKSSLFGPLFVLGYPAFSLGIIALTFVSGRIHALVWGNGAQQASNDGRAAQLAIGIPKLYQQPWGYGMDKSAEVVGFIAPGSDFPTIDSYYLYVALDFGVHGFLVYFSIYLFCIGYAAKAILTAKQDSPYLRALVPCIVAMSFFFISKSVLSQQSNHPLAFLILGMVAGLLWRQRQLNQSAAGQAADARAVYRAA